MARKGEVPVWNIRVGSDTFVGVGPHHKVVGEMIKTLGDGIGFDDKEINMHSVSVPRSEHRRLSRQTGGIGLVRVDPQGPKKRGIHRKKIYYSPNIHLFQL